MTEGLLLRNFQQAAQRLTELANMDIQLLLDDFGTGYSSLSYLHKLPFDFVKIDRSFVRGMAGPQGDPGIVRAIVDLARNMNIKTIAEGVESVEDLAVLRELGCQYAQGFHYAKPLPEREALRFVVEASSRRLGGRG